MVLRVFGIGAMTLWSEFDFGCGCYVSRPHGVL